MSEGIKIIAVNRKARHEYHIEDSVEAGIVLKGSEVKALRDGKVNFADAFCKMEGEEMYLLNCHISPYSHGGYDNHEPRRPRKLLLHRREIERLQKSAEQQGYTLIPLRFYLKNGLIKLEVGVAKGKKLYDKREDMKERATKREIEAVDSAFHVG